MGGANVTKYYKSGPVCCPRTEYFDYTELKCKKINESWNCEELSDDGKCKRCSGYDPARGDN